MWRFYEKVLRHYPLQTKVASAASLGFAGDFFAQKIQHRDRDLDLERLFAFTAFGGLYTGAFNHVWLDWLSKTFPGKHFKAVAKKQFVQHGLLNPIIYIPLFYTFTGTLRGESWLTIKSKMVGGYWETLLAIWAVWGPSTGLMFFVIPVRHHTLWLAGVSFGWTCLLSLLSNREIELSRQENPTEIDPSP